ncbi:hypothetical protein ABGV43_30220 [Paenibacillus amylolyticus]|uniref:hypothetical protein n=1 Tax=Paenibacillus amylolyticus TaxID=1451 RepID=UPI0032426A15
MLQTLIGAGIGAIISCFFYILARNRSRINYQTSNLKIIGNLSLNLPEDFEVTLSGERIESLYKSQIIIWNGGTTTINGSDIVKDDPLTVVFGPGTKIFNISVVGESREINKFNCRVSPSRENECQLNFDFWDKKDGVVLELLHTESPEQPKIKGTVKGLVNGIKSKGQVEYIKNQKKLKWKSVLLSLGVLLILTLILSIFIVSLSQSLQNITEKYSLLLGFTLTFIGLFSGFVIIVIVTFLSTVKKKYPRSIKFKE